MQIPDTLKEAIEQLCLHTRLIDLQEARKTVSSHYKASKNSKGLFNDPLLLRSYLITRMPATFAACKAALHWLPEAPKSVLDVGAGPGSGSWAAMNLFEGLKDFHLIEREKAAIEVGKTLAKGTPLEMAVWEEGDVLGRKSFPKVDLSMVSYVVAEVGVEAVDWAALFTSSKMVMIVEPGTPDGYERILQIRNRLIDLGGFVLAPCPHEKPCPMHKSDWCHFGARIERTRLHRMLKEGSLGFEDEKFSYLIVGKEPQKRMDRILAPPEIGRGFVKLKLCQSDGLIQMRTVTRKDKETYRIAKKSSWGD